MTERMQHGQHAPSNETQHQLSTADTYRSCPCLQQPAQLKTRRACWGNRMNFLQYVATLVCHTAPLEHASFKLRLLSISHLICVIFPWPAGMIQVTAHNIPNTVPKCETVHMYIYPLSGLNIQEDANRIKASKQTGFYKTRLRLNYGFLFNILLGVPTKPMDGIRT